MKYEFLRRGEGGGRLLLIFAGWGSDGRIFREACDALPAGWDALCVSGYDRAEFDRTLLGGYSTIYLVAWSLGVAAAGRMLSRDEITCAVAVNGTPHPVSDNFGIPTAIYEGTFRTLDERNLRKFRRRMVQNGEEFARVLEVLPETPDIEALKNQLSFIQAFTTSEAPSGLSWDNVYISTDDRIIPTANQRRYWERPGACRHINMMDHGHVADFRTIIEECILDPDKVAAKFKASQHTYTENATPQRIICERLAAMLPESTAAGNILEIGSGTGLLTQEWRKHIDALRAVYVDLCPTEGLSGAQDETYIAADAEQWIEECDEEFDYILSASALQWFSNPLRFIATAARRLRKGGRLLVSSFLPGNLKELNALRPSPLRYIRREEIERVMKENFREYEIRDEEIAIDFGSAREALLHLRRTGVGGVGKSGLPLQEICRRLSAPDGTARLTYRPVYVNGTR